MNFPRRTSSIRPAASSSFKWCESVGALTGNCSRSWLQAAQPGVEAMCLRISNRRGSERARAMTRNWREVRPEDALGLARVAIGRGLLGGRDAPADRFGNLRSTHPRGVHIALVLDDAVE